MASNEALHLYKQFLRYATRFSNYNFRDYAIRRSRDGFVANRGLTDPAAINDALAKGRAQLEVLKRQSVISQMYKGEKLIVEV
jgi:hypothetical protein